MVLQKKGEETLDIPEEIEKVLASLASGDALKIFVEAGKGIESSTAAIKKLHTTQKKYYVWLKRLVEAELVEKRGNVYIHTMLGKLCYKMGESLLNALNLRDQLELADKVMKSDTLSIGEKDEILRSMSKESLFGTASLADVIHEVKMITEYDHFIEEVIKLLDGAKDGAYVATNKTDLRVKDAVFNVIDRGVKLYFLSSEGGFSENAEVLRMLLSPASIRIVRKLINSRELNIKVMNNLAFSFVIIDSEYGVIELPQLASQGFYVAFEFKNAVLCQKLISVFSSLYEKANEDPRIKFVKRTLRHYK
jgi:hypothetical protein